MEDSGRSDSDHGKWVKMLAAAAQSGDAALVNSVLRRPGVHVDEPDAQGWRAVHHAAVLNSAEIVHGLVSAGADVNAVQLSRTSAPTALHVAASSGCPDALAALQGAGASVDLTEEGTKGFSKTALHRACEVVWNGLGFRAHRPQPPSPSGPGELATRTEVLLLAAF